MPLRTVSLDQLTIDDEAAFAAVPLYPRLKEVLRRSGHRFYVPTPGTPFSWDRALFLNLTYWNGEAGADVLCEQHLAADVVTHIAWHHLVGERVTAAAGSSGTATAMLFAESVASAFDLHVLGRLWRQAPGSEFVTTQVPILSEAAQEAGITDDDFATLMTEISDEPDRAFEDLRQLLFDAATALLGCRDAVEAQTQLERFAGHRFAGLLHHYQLSNWILYGRAHARADASVDEAVRGFDATLRRAPASLGWLVENWVQ
ncbi:MAG TPA: hypothetical protein VN914_01110 [Polyangia bacterium]|nr:hypothetical protein [Polyangia bacterium]